MSALPRHRRGQPVLSEDFRAPMLEAQGGCAICGRLDPGDACLDHDHATGEVRGVLCNNCNRALGLLGDSSVSVARALQYLLASRPPDPALGVLRHLLDKVLGPDVARLGLRELDEALIEREERLAKLDVAQREAAQEALRSLGFS